MNFDIWPMVSASHNLGRCKVNLYSQGQSVGILNRFDIGDSSLEAECELSWYFSGHLRRTPQSSSKHVTRKC